MSTLTPHAARIIRASFQIDEGGTYRCAEQYIARNVADASHAHHGMPVRVYLDSLGFIVTQAPLTRTDAALVYTANKAGR